ncbi:MAG: SDR family oxidoreductase [Chloroflexi bacterium]|nr:MAG: SDR family oxidoreductase [Chloroflexota bacterium]
MEIRFDEQVVLITGASTGIGAALARAFGDAGAKVVVHYHRSKEAAEAVARDVADGGGEAMLVQADAANPADLAAMVKAVMAEYGHINILINNAGDLVQRTPVAEIPDDVYHQIMDINMTATFHMCQLVVPVMKQQGSGNIINVTSIAARNGGGGGSVIYATSKGAVSTFTRGLAKELAPANIRVNALSPGTILTPFHERHSPPERMAAMVATIPMARAGVAEECVGAVFFLASEEMSSYVTGQIIEVNGGQFMP